MPSTSTPAAPSVTTRERIISASAALFMQRGYSGSGLKDISKASAAPIGSLYHHFPGGKEELAAETLRAAGAAYGALVTGVLIEASREADPATAVRICFAAAGETLRSSGYADACPIATVALEVASSDEALRLVTDEIFSGWLTGLAGWLEHGGVAPERAAELSMVVLAALEGGFLLSRVAQDTAAMDALGAAMADLIAAELA